ncbi:HD domain-containing phosphohydrolase [Paraclostridium bifermentans]|uniref:HD domain-containing phosphohydrolase n=1 Tax=Paraclostridium bifermentans TaxID=1490 RepID=UPI00359C41C4
MKKKRFKIFIYVIIFSMCLISLISIYNNKLLYQSVKLTKQERQWIEENKSREIVADVASNNSIYYYQSKDGDFGVFKDLESYINQLYGINIVTKYNSMDEADLIWAAETNSFKKEGFIKTAPYDFSELNIYTKEKIESLVELKGKKIAVYKNFKSLIKDYGKYADFIIVDNLKDVKELYESEQVYGFVSDTTTLKSLKISPEKQVYSNNISNKYNLQLSIAVKEDKILRDLMDKALRSISKKQMNKIKIENELMYIKYNLGLTKEEKKWLKENNQISMKIDYKLHPYYYEYSYNRGILNEYINKLEYLLNVSFVDFDENKDISKEPQIYFGVYKDDEESRHLELMKPYNSYNLYIYSSSEKVIDDMSELEGHTIGVVKDGDRNFLKENLIDFQYIQYKNYEDMIEDLHDGTIDYFLGDNYIMGHFTEEHNMYKNIFHVGVVEKVFYESIGVNKDYEMLASIMKKVDSNINTDVAPKFNEVSIEDADNVDYKSIAKIVVIFIGIMTVSSIYIFKLRKEVKLKNEFHNNLETALSKNEKLVLSLVETLEDVNALNDSDTGLHIKRVSGYCKVIASYMGCDEQFINEIVYFSSLHDIGKVGIPDNILKKPGKLTKEEMEIMKKHVAIGYDIVKKNNLGAVANNIILYHHERYDGEGYINGLKGKDIPLEARILAIADVYDALRMERCYKKGFSHETAMDIIISEKGKHLDPEIVEILIDANEEINEIFNSNK